MTPITGDPATTAATRDADRTSRRRRLAANIAGGLLGRGGGALIGFATVPLAFRALGADRYGLYVTLTAVAAWLQVGSSGVGKGLMNALIGCYARGDDAEGRRYVASLWLTLLAVVAVIGLGAALVIPAVNWASVFGLEGTGLSSEIASTLAVAVAFTLGSLALSPAESVLSAHQQDQRNAYWAFARSVAVFGATAAAAATGLGVTGFAAMTGAAATLVAAASAVWVFRSFRPQLRPRRADVSIAHVRGVGSRILWFAAVDVAAILVFQIDRYLIIVFGGAREVAGYDVALRLYLVAYGLFAVVLVPLWPAMGEALRKGDVAWTRAAVARLSRASAAAMAVLSLALVVWGDPIVGLLAGTDAHPGPWIFAAVGAYFVARVWTDVHSVALYGLELQHALARAAFVHGLLAVTGAVFLGSFFGALGVAAANALAFAASTAWWIPLRLRRALRERDQ